MNRVASLTQAYSLAPWRKQINFLVVASVILVIIAISGTIYLTVTSQANQYGRQIQYDIKQIRQLDIDISDMQARYAALTAASRMARRAKAMGFKQPDSETVMYLHVPGYIPLQTIRIANSATHTVISAKFLPPEYTESVFTWLLRSFERMSSKYLFEVKP